MVLLAIVLIMLGIGCYVKFNLVPTSDNQMYITAGLGVVVLGLVLAGKVKENVGMILTAIWLLMLAAMYAFHFDFEYSALVMPGLPIVAGGFLLIGL
jgi:putative Ca2+/H+ antiporter (TMEM165/GDT1 family)